MEKVILKMMSSVKGGVERQSKEESEPKKTEGP
jgi:hypothetical protein